MSEEGIVAKKIRVVIAKVGLDGHDLGAKMVTLSLRNAGMEVFYTGYGQTPEEVVSLAVQEDVDVIGCSFLCGGYLELMQKVIDRLREAGASDKLVLVGGTIVKEDIEKLKAIGVAEVFGTSAPIQKISEFIKHNVTSQ